MKIKLDDIKKDQPLKAPDDYFKSLPDKIMAKLKESEKPERKHVSLRPWIVYGAAASITLLIAVGLAFYGNPETTSAEEILAEVSEEAILDYLTDESLTTEEILEVAFFTEMEAQAIQEESFSDYELESLDNMIEELEFIEQEINTL